MDTILQQNSVIVAPAASENPARAIDEKPTRPACLDILRRTKKNWGPAEMAAEARYFEELHAWEARMEAKGREYKPSSIYQMKQDAGDALRQYLQATGAPAEVITLLDGYRELNWIYLNYGHRWYRLEKAFYVILGEYMPAVRQAIRTMRECLKASKA